MGSLVYLITGLSLLWMLQNSCLPCARRLLSPYFTSVQIGVSGEQLLVENGVPRVAIGELVYKCPTFKVREQ